MEHWNKFKDLERKYQAVVVFGVLVVAGCIVELAQWAIR